MSLNELEKLANAVGESTITSIACRDYFMVLKPQTIKQLIALCRLQHDALLVHMALTRPIDTSSKAISAYDAFEKGEVK